MLIWKMFQVKLLSSVGFDCVHTLFVIVVGINTSLMRAEDNGHEKVVYVLLKSGADVNELAVSCQNVVFSSLTVVC